LRPIDPQQSVGLRIEAEGIDGARAALFVYRHGAPQLAPVARDQQERIARDGAQLLARDPAVLQIEELNLVEPRRADARVRLLPGLAVVLARQQDREERGALGVEIAGQEDSAGRGTQRRQLQVYRAGLAGRARQSEGADVLLGALKSHANRLLRIQQQTPGNQREEAHRVTQAYSHRRMSLN